MNEPTAEYHGDPTEAPPEVPGFELLRAIGAGGFGQVWLARNTATGCLRAVKVISLKQCGRTDAAGREITSITRLEENVRTRHANLLTIHHVGKTEDHLFYVMDPADDQDGGSASAAESYQSATLEHHLANSPLPPQTCLHYAEQLLSGLAHLHEAGMVHRDVKPANCLFVDGQLKLGDFGLLAEASPQVSRVGTRKYMPPDGRMDTRADVFAAGLVIYEMLTGLPVESFPRLGERAQDVGDDPVLRRLNQFVLRACQQEPERRFRDAQHMLRELKAPTPRGCKRPPGRRWLLAAAALLVIAAVATTVTFLSGRPETSTTKPPARVSVNFITHPFEATIFLDNKRLDKSDGEPYTTPCTVPDLPARSHHVEFRHPGHGKLDAGQRDFGTAREIEASWE